MVTNTLRSLVAEPRPARPPRRVWRDWVLVVAVLVGAGLELAVRPEVTWAVDTVLLPVGLAVALLWRRTAPLVVVAVSFGVTGALSLATLLGAPPATEVYSQAWILLLPYALARWGSGREAAIGLPVIVVSALLATAAVPTGLPDAVLGFVILLFTVALGASIRYRSGERIREIDRVRLLEREQLARELHDTVAHHISAIAIQAQAGRAVAATHPDRAVEALGVIEDAASRTLAEMRTMVGVLRSGDEPERTPLAGIGDIVRLADGAAGLPRIDVALSGDLDGLGPSLEAAAYRLAQESITNAVRHARDATHIDVSVEGIDGGVRLTVRDDGVVRHADERSWGYGLIGMAERASLLGGTLEAGPDPDGGWTVRALLPRTGGVA